MIGSIRKHSKWLWWLIAGLTIVSFVAFMGSAPNRNGGGGTGNLGTIYGHVVTAQDCQRAKAEFYLYFWLRNGQWPDKAGGFSADDMDREVYLRLLLEQKAQKLGVQVSRDALVAAANQFLQTLGRNGQPVAMDKFLAQVLAPENLDAADLQNFLRNELVVQQLAQVLGLSGALVTPQEAGQLYDREHQEVSAQAVFFNASNYLAQVAATPDAVAQFYTNFMAAYREPDRVQVSYVFFNLTNYLAAARTKELARTNFEQYVDAAYRQYGATEFADAKTPDEAKARIRDAIFRKDAFDDAKAAANDFAPGLFAMEPARPENLASCAKSNGLAVHVTAPFSASAGPQEFDAPAAFVRSAFQLNAETPFAGPIPAADGTYIIALAGQLPSTIPPLEQIRSRVTEDFRQHTAVDLAQSAGTNFYFNVAVQMAAGNSFGKAVSAAGQSPQLLPPFSLSTTDLPGLGSGAGLDLLKQAAFTTSPGHISRFQPTSAGGFVLFVQQLLPLDTAEKNKALPKYIADISRMRQSEAFNSWLQIEANRELRDTPLGQRQMAAAAKSP